MKSVSEIEQLVAEETKHRLEEMESPEYEFPKTIPEKGLYPCRPCRYY